MSIEKYLSPIEPGELGYYPSEFADTLGKKITTYLPTQPFPAIPKNGLVIVGAGEDRAAERNAGCGAAPNEIRRYLYQLALPVKETQIVDLGNIILGQTTEDTYYAVSEVVATVVSEGNTLILLGGSQDLTFAAYKGFELMNRIINIAAIDPRFDLEENDEMTSRTWLQDIVMQTPNYLFFHSNVGYQTYYVGNKYIQLMEELKFDAYRLGEIQSHMDRAEALLRNADLVSVDISAVRQSDAPGNGAPSPHGFYGEELCQMMRYAGMSSKTQCLGVFEVNPSYDNAGQTAHMMAQALWYFIEGFYSRKNDNPLSNPDEFTRYLVPLESQDLELCFYKSNQSDRWWVLVPCYDDMLREIYSNHLLLPCTYDDYLQCLNTCDVPALWWCYFKRLNSRSDVQDSTVDS